MDHDEISITPIFSAGVRRRRRVLGVRFSGRLIITTVTRRADDVSRWISNILHLFSSFRRQLVVGLGVQWRPKSANSDREIRPATLQLSVGSRCLIYQIVRAKNIPRSLRRFLDDDLITFAGVGINYDCILLDQRGLFVTNPKEIRELAGERMGRRNASMASMAEEILDWDSVAMVKTQSIGMSNWEVPNLSHRQILYACVDAQVSYQLGLRLIWGN